MVTPLLVTETSNRRHCAIRSEIASEQARALSRAMFINMGGYDPLHDMTFDVPTVVRAHHDYPSPDRFESICEWEERIL